MPPLGRFGRACAAGRRDGAGACWHTYRRSTPPLILSLMHLPVPYDPLELVPDGAQPIQSAEDRAATIELLNRARDLSNVRLYPYDLKTTFSTYASLSSD